MKVKIQNDFRVVIVFDNGSYLFAKTFIKAKKQIITLELCFSTSMIGYQESISDPSYAGQALVFSFPHIGNTGINYEDSESCNIYTKALIFSEKPTEPSNYRSKISLENFLLENNIIGAFDVDTREIISQIRLGKIKNICIGVFDNNDEVEILDMAEKAKSYTYNFKGLLDPILSCKKRANSLANLVEDSKKHIQDISIKKFKTLVIDYGVKLNIVKCLIKNNFLIEDLVPYTINYNQIDFSKYDCVVLSNGPGDPAEAYDLSRDLIQKIFDLKIPILGICLGHQIIGACFEKFNMETFKMSQGHRGINHPVKSVSNGKIQITSQNHGFAIRSKNPELKNEDNQYIDSYSLFDQSISGLRCNDNKILTTQYHPESSPGTHDSVFIFKEFYNMLCK